MGLKISAESSGYFLEPKIMKIAGEYRFEYIKGNSRREKVFARITSVQLRQKKGRFYVHIPHFFVLNEERDAKLKAAKEFRAFFSSNLDNSKYLNKGQEYIGKKVLSVESKSLSTGSLLRIKY